MEVVEILAPEAPLEPTAVVEAPSSVSACGGLVVDGSQSTGSGGRAWLSVAWSVTQLDASREGGDASQLLEAVSAGNSTTLALSPNALAGIAGARVVLGLALTNAVGGSSFDFAAASVTVKSGVIPDVVIVGGAAQSSTRPSAFSVFADASVSGCAGDALSTATLAYEWTLLQAPTLASISTDPFAASGVPGKTRK